LQNFIRFMSKYNTLLLIHLVIIFGCSQKQNEEIKLVSTAEFIDRVDTVSIAITPEQLGKYGSFHISKDNYYVAYNRFKHCIDIFDLGQKTYSHSVQLEDQGPNYVPKGASVHKSGHEFLLSGVHDYYRVSRDGIVIGKISLREGELEKEGYRSGFGGANIANFRSLSVDVEKQIVYKQLYKFIEGATDIKKIDSTAYFACSIDLANWTTKLIMIKYPKPYVQSFAKTGFLGDASVLKVGHKFVFNFPGRNEIYTYDNTTKLLKVHNPVITNRNEMKIDIGDYGDDYLKAAFMGQRLSPRYLAVKYDLHNNVYYRIHKTKAKSKRMFDTEYFLIKMDSDFRTITEYNIGDLFHTFQIHDGYLYFPIKDVDKDALNTLKVCRVNL
jgi:hypothetical protein